MSRYRLYPTATQETALLDHCQHARYVWNLAVEQWSMWTRDKGPTPNYVVQSAQLTQARAEFSWLRDGSQTVQQQALRDFHHAVQNFYRRTHGRPSWRKAGQHEGFRIVGLQASRIVKLNRKWAAARIPKVGWVRFRLSRALPDAKSYRVSRDRAGRWHVAFAVIPAPIPAPGTGLVVGIDRGVAVSAALSTGELLMCPVLSKRQQARLKRLQRCLASSNLGSNRRARVKAAIAKLLARARARRKDWAEKLSTDLARRLEEKATGRVERVNAAYTSQTCSICGHRAPESRKSQAIFQCVACGQRSNADVNAAMNIAAGRAVNARREKPIRVSQKREPQLATSG